MRTAGSSTPANGNQTEGLWPRTRTWAAAARTRVARAHGTSTSRVAIATRPAAALAPPAAEAPARRAETSGPPVAAPARPAATGTRRRAAGPRAATSARARAGAWAPAATWAPAGAWVRPRATRAATSPTRTRTRTATRAEAAISPSRPPPNRIRMRPGRPPRAFLLRLGGGEQRRDQASRSADVMGSRAARTAGKRPPIIPITTANTMAVVTMAGV